MYKLYNLQSTDRSSKNTRTSTFVIPESKGEVGERWAVMILVNHFPTLNSKILSKLTIPCHNFFSYPISQNLAKFDASMYGPMLLEL
mmetsp:Transcript_5499/g.11392  ORF Transcript_5499/g.11392 Transcript_5499/m.11392 type:complete len:87 (-) Transcript_5499:6735-6995(-)